MAAMSTDTHDTESLIALLDRADTHPGATALRTRTYELLQPQPGALVVDVGCGTGRAVAELTETGAKAIGVDVSAQMIAVARARWRGAEFRMDETTADAVRRIFAEYLDGNGDRVIADLLNRDGIPCPSAHRRDQNRHRLADGWQGGSVRAILDNPRYTGYAIFGRWTKHETLLDPEDVAAGHVVRFRRAAPDRSDQALLGPGLGLGPGPGAVVTWRITSHRPAPS
jgi:SAM-dependent methyltransferase